MLQQVLKGESVKRADVIKGDVITKTVSTLHKASKVNYACDWTLDFSGCTKDQMIELASRPIVINIQRGFRETKDLESYDGKYVDVAEMLAAERTKTSPKDKIAKELAKLGDETAQAEFLAALMAEVRGEE